MSSALTTLLEHVERERKLAQATLLRAEEQQTRLSNQARQLVSYRAEYQQRWASHFSRRGEMDIVQCYHSFMARLEEALVQQNQQAEFGAEQVQRLRERLQAAEMRVASVRKLIERRQFEQRRLLDQREQRQSDEQAQQARWRGSRFETAPH